MSDRFYMIWFVATAVMTVGVLLVGTLMAAEVLPRHPRRPHPQPGESPSAVTEARVQATTGTADEHPRQHRAA